MLLLVYAMLTHVGALSGAAWPGGSTGADTLSNIARGLFGPVGQVLLAAIFVIACFNTCVGLIACVGQYFHELLPRIPYPAIAAFFAAASMIISNIGLAGIIRLSTPVLNAIYPVAIVLIVLSFLPKPEKHGALYCGAEHCRGIPDSGLVAAAAGTAAERTRLRLADAGCGRSADWLAASEEN